MAMVFESNKDYKAQSRYQIMRVINNDGVRYLETYNQKFVPERDDDIYHIVKVKEENRLDIISQNYYGSPIYWWAIALANDFIDPFIVNAGTMIRIPKMETLIDPSYEILERGSR